MKNRANDQGQGGMLTVVVCTYNRADLLSEALESLCHQTALASEYEVLVVDNNSRDNTHKMVDAFCSRFSNVRYCREETQGLSNARNRGWREARADYVGYVDDDCKVPGNWVATAISILTHRAPGMFGGPHDGFYNAPQPRWWREQYGTFALAETPGELGEGDYLQGNNMVIRRELLEAVGGFDSRFGMTGETIAYAEETELQDRIRAMRPDAVLYYDPRLSLSHLVRAEQMTLRWNAISHFSCGRYSCRIPNHDSVQKGRVSRIRLLGGVAVTLARLCRGVLLASVVRDRKRFPCFSNYIYEVSFMHLQHLGALYERCIDTK